jgi:two-component system CheB/CheR fusion protein
MKTLVSKQHIIAIGASAGGMEAIQSFFDHTPLDGVSYVIIQHLSPDYKSRMAELLKHHSKLEICMAENNMTVKVNAVYLIPNTKFMSIKNGKLKLDEKAGKHSPYMTIDTFFTSLAAERGDKAIGIILSGTGKDGAEGIKAIQKSGGMVMVQDPATAKFEGMPTEAINTGLADKVLAPELMPGAIEDYVSSAALKEEPAAGKHVESDENTLLDILNVIKSQLPLDFSNYKRPTIVRRIKRRMSIHNFEETEKYLAFLENNPEELGLLANDFLIGVTSFFRDEEAWAALEKEIIPEIVRVNEPGNPLKIWVTGCATGEEAYSIAILVREYLIKTKLSIEVKIFATDINKVTLDTASKGIYSEKIQREVSKERLAAFFTKSGHTYKINQEIRKMVIFAQHDLGKNPPYCNIDLISCRNVLIYMNLVLQKKVLSSLHFGVKQGGYLFLGSSENVNILRGYFSETNKKWKFFKNQKPQNFPAFDSFSTSAMPMLIPRTEPFAKSDQVSFQKINFLPDVNEVVLSESGFAGVCIDESFKVIGAFGDLGKYLHPKTFNFELNELWNGPLSIA